MILKELICFAKESFINFINLEFIDSSFIAYLLYVNNFESEEVTKAVMEQNITKRNSPYSYLLVKDYGFDKEWAENIIEMEKSAEWACLMVRDCGSDRKWAEKIIEFSLDRDFWLYWMSQNCGSTIKE